MNCISTKVSILAALVLASGSTLSPASAATWKIDPAHSHAQFSIRHMMISNVRGDFSRISGVVDYDSKNISKAKVSADIDVSTVDTGEPDRDKHLRGTDFFDVGKYPAMMFKSKKVIGAKDGKFKLVGDLTLHGVTKEVTLDVDGPTPEIKDPKGNVKIGASASTKINRKNFGITTGGIMDNGGALIGEDVTISIDLEMTKEAASVSTNSSTK
jgi:polyisoprenoid-binding protein YceI